jgi:hypothetical protein
VGDLMCWLDVRQTLLPQQSLHLQLAQPVVQPDLQYVRIPGAVIRAQPLAAL